MMVPLPKMAPAPGVFPPETVEDGVSREGAVRDSQRPRTGNGAASATSKQEDIGGQKVPFPEKVLFAILRVPSLKIAPPSTGFGPDLVPLFETMLSVMLRVP